MKIVSVIKAVIVLLILSFISCKKTETIFQGKESDEQNSFLRAYSGVNFSDNVDLISQQNGVLVFPSEQVFQNIVDELDNKHDLYTESNNSQSEQNEFKISLAFENMLNFSSLRKLIQSEREKWFETNQTQGDPDDKWVEGTGIRTVLSSNGAIQIDKKIYVCKEFGETFEVSDGDFSTMNSIISGQNLGLKNTIVHKADGSIIDGADGKLIKAKDTCFSWNSKTLESVYANSQRKIRGKVWVHNLPFYANIGSETEHYKKKNNGNWDKTKASTIHTGSGGTLYDGGCKTFGTITLSDTKNNKKDIQESITYWNQVTKSKPNQYSSNHSAIDGSYVSPILTITLN